MAKYCTVCGKKLPWLWGFSACPDCKRTRDAELARQEAELAREKEALAKALIDELNAITTDVIKSVKITEKQVEKLKKYSKNELIVFYLNVYQGFENNKELDEQEINTLQKIQDSFQLTQSDVNYNDLVRPYVYVRSIKQYGELPTPNFSVDGGSPIVLKKDEVIYHGDGAIAKELKSVSLGYSGGSRGISIPLGKGFRYRVGSTRGHVIRQEQLVETSRGALIISNYRLFLHPVIGCKPISIPLKKILSYQCYENGIEVYKDGREKGYVFSPSNRGSVEVFGICLQHLLSNLDNKGNYVQPKKTESQNNLENDSSPTPNRKDRNDGTTPAEPSSNRDSIGERWNNLSREDKMAVIKETSTFPGVVNKKWNEISLKTRERLTTKLT